MRLPAGQDVIAETDLLGWTSGPLPNADLEHIAWLIFGFRFPQAEYDSSLFSAERNDCRRLALKLRVKFLKMNRWTISNAAAKLTDESCQLLFGDKAINTNTRAHVQDFAESYLEDLNKLFGGGDLRRAEGDEGWRYVPEHEPDESEVEDLGTSKGRVQ
jgi:hypothetical protein